MATLVALTLALAVSCGDDSSDSRANGVLSGKARAAACSKVFADGAPVDTADWDVPCTRKDGTIEVYGAAINRCTDGRTLVWNDEAWGYVGETWHRYPLNAAEQVAPETERNACKPG